MANAVTMDTKVDGKSLNEISKFTYIVSYNGEKYVCIYDESYVRLGDEIIDGCASLYCISYKQGLVEVIIDDYVVDLNSGDIF